MGVKSKARQLSAVETNHLIEAGVDPYSAEVETSGDKPVEYITNSANFCKKKFFVDERVLIPRVETEQIIELALEHGLVLSRKKNGKVKLRSKKKKFLYADVGTGSGCIGITLALELLQKGYNFKGLLYDISDDALEVTKINAEKLLPKKQIKTITGTTPVKVSPREVYIYKSDLLETLPERIKLDLLLANLPYIPSDRIEELGGSVKDHEPHLALDGGTSGFDYIRRILKQAKSALSKDGIVILEVDDTHTNSSAVELKGWKIEIVNDLNGKNRFWVLKRSKP